MALGALTFPIWEILAIPRQTIVFREQSAGVFSSCAIFIDFNVEEEFRTGHYYRLK